MLDIISHQVNQNHNEILLHNHWDSRIKRPDNKYCQECKELVETLMPCWKKCIMIQQLLK